MHGWGGSARGILAEGIRKNDVQKMESRVTIREKLGVAMSEYYCMKIKSKKPG